MSEQRIHSAETGRQLRIEETVLIFLGFGHHLDTLLGTDTRGNPITGRNFLDGYPADSPHRQETEDLLIGFADMTPADPGYEGAKTYVLRYLNAYFN